VRVALLRRRAGSRRGALWDHPDFLRVWGGQAVSLIGDTITGLAVPLTAVLVLDAGATAMGVLAGCSPPSSPQRSA
jgi:hypothetical protein